MDALYDIDEEVYLAVNPDVAQALPKESIQAGSSIMVSRQKRKPESSVIILEQSPPVYTTVSKGKCVGDTGRQQPVGGLVAFILFSR